MTLRPFRSSDLEPLIELTIATFGPFYEDSFRSIVGDAIVTNQHGTWRADYRDMWLGLHDPRHNKHVVVAEDGDALLGFAAWHTNADRRSGEIEIIAVAADLRRQHVGTALCAHVFEAMRQAGAEVVSIGTGGDRFHEAARAFYDSLGMTAVPLVRYYAAL
ncbi:GNAT family N-acetyltransferase [Micromonospora sp. PLK6-60]|uniref:GNAT family N-acetyltransferase n=1 Tax=Micromonospora sp. PLK6-60 TaxID=2873383 RepID=UPI001CA6E74E|nr:GNAT family N-acetyltransferase [Micromonospora sp. PLK6-60]MBY8871343.1 GNAT family N-acetyltransferase [Micromonospora sp. PLK6-60]